ncbi:MAG: type II toxin-antitoxin system YafQ family toxin [Prevotellaceae bacterium]|jgi:mRNA interferase YafQ|nr:type II toxin-antitoxin system YafQ family toxin [Prevotellaceae bacterium]
MPKIKSGQIEALFHPENDRAGNPIEYKYSLLVTNRFKKDVKRNQRSGLDLELLVDAVVILTTTGTLPSKYKPHPLSGNYAGYMECHIQPDYLLVWQQNDKELIIICIAAGSHAYLLE